MTSVNKFAALLHHREYTKEITAAEAELAKKSDIVIVFGASDDLMQFYGAINDEIGCYGGGIAYLTPEGLLQNKCNEDRCPYFEKEKLKAITIKAIWNVEGYSFIYKTNIAHETFDILECDDLYCRGIVFHMNSLSNNTLF